MNALIAASISILASTPSAASLKKESKSVKPSGGKREYSHFGGNVY